MRATTPIGTIILDDHAVTIERRALLGGATRTIRTVDLTGIDYRRPGPFQAGYLRLLHSGNAGLSARLREHDPDTIMFNLEHEADMRPIRAALMERVTGRAFDAAEPSNEPQLAGQAQTVALLIAAAIGCAVWYFVLTS